MLEHNARFNSRDYDKFERMELTESSVRDVTHELKTYYIETLARRFNVHLLGHGKRVFYEVRRRKTTDNGTTFSARAK